MLQTLKLASDLRQKKQEVLQSLKLSGCIYIFFSTWCQEMCWEQDYYYIIIAFYICCSVEHALATTFSFFFYSKNLSRPNDRKIIPTRISGGPFLIGKQKQKGPHDHESRNPWMHSLSPIVSQQLDIIKAWDRSTRKDLTTTLFH